MTITVETETEATTVTGVWLAYELAEREAWDEYTEDPSWIAGRVYIAAEQLAAKRRDRAIQRLRYAQEGERRERAEQAERDALASAGGDADTAK